MIRDMILQGTFTALITPFIEDRVDTEGLRFLIQRQIEAGIAGVVLLGTTGENPTISDEEKQTIIRIGVEEAQGKIQVLVGTGSHSTRNTIKYTKEAKELGADGALIITPYYNKPPQQGIFDHFQAIVSATEFPVIIYNSLGRSGTNIETSTLLKLAELPYIVGVKEASGNANQFADVIYEIRSRFPQFSVLCGDDALALPLISLGGNGLISVASNLVPEEVNNMVNAALQGDFKMARKWHEELLPLFRLEFIETNPIPIKMMMEKLGLPSGKCRLPLSSLKEENQKKLHDYLLTANYC